MITSQADDFESQLRDARPEAEIAAPVEASEVATAASTAAGEDDEDGFNTRFVDTFEGVDWSRLSGFIRPPRTQSQRKSWVYEHGYRVASQANPSRIFFVCCECHRSKRPDSGVLETTQATSSAAIHLLKKHGITRSGKALVKLPPGQRSLTMLTGAGVRIS